MTPGHRASGGQRGGGSLITQPQGRFLSTSPQSGLHSSLPTSTTLVEASMSHGEYEVS